MEGAVRHQVELYGKIARSLENLKKIGSANITVGLVEARLQALESNWGKFETQHDQLYTKFWDTLDGSDYDKNEIPLLAEEAYLNQKGAFLDILRELKKEDVAAVLDASIPHAAPLPMPAATPPTPHKTTLPRIQLPQFSGRYEDWPSFRDLFQSIIGKDKLLAPVEKLHYLKACLKGEADLLVRDLTTTDENFDRAWNTLTRHFENKKLLVRSYLSQFTALPKLKTESSAELRKLYHGVLGTVSALESIDRPIKSGEDLFVHLIIELFDSRTRREWENETSSTTTPPSYDELIAFLENRVHALDALQFGRGESNPKSNSTPMRQTRALHARKQDNKPGRCSMCQRNHYVMFCDAYKSKTAAERKRHVEDNDLCINCLGRHKLSDCASTRTCSVCQLRHHSSLHEACQTTEAVRTSHAAQLPPVSPLPAASSVLLATARVRVADRFGVFHSARALIDQGSESSMVSEALAQRLKLSRTKTLVAIYGVLGNQTGLAHGMVRLAIAPLRGGRSLTVAALVVPRVTIYDGGIKAAVSDCNHLRGLELADPEFLAKDQIDILLGVDVHGIILQSGLLKGGPHEPVAQQTSLGWILSGAISPPTTSPRTTTHCCRTQDDLTELVRGFWHQEELPNSPAILAPDERDCEEFFARTHSRDSTGRYTVRLPVIAPLPALDSTRRTALRALAGMERRFLRNERLHQLYVDFLQQYEDLGHMTPAEPAEPGGGRVSYLPHHGVMKEASTSTKLRVVFNGSTTTVAGDSLNRSLMVGPNLLPPLSEILLRWRLHRYVLATDVEKMYRQILVHPDDRDLQRIIWRSSPRDTLTEYQLNTVTYGLSCAPFLAMRTIRQLAEDEAMTYPRGAAALRRDVYMDDILTGAPTIAEALELQQQLINLCSAGGFPLRKWSANSPTLLENIPADHRLQRDLRSWRPQDTHSTLGLQWHPGSDGFSFATHAVTTSTITKRSVLSLTARLFDPLGWLAPVVVSAKIAFQTTWLQGVGWDTPLDKRSSRKWREYQEALPSLDNILVPRWIGPESSDDEVEIHGFADASERAYAGVVYLRTKGSKSCRIHLVAAKTKVAPIKPVTLPRLELCATALLTRLAIWVRNTLSLGHAPLHLWSDSTVALGWIRGHPTRWRTYVANRVADIQTAAPTALWHHVPTQDNPADCASRGLSPGELAAHRLWWRGPPWLSAESPSWPSSGGFLDDGELPEVRTRGHVTTPRPQLENKEVAELTRFSSLHRLLRVSAWCRRWLRLRSTWTVTEDPYTPCSDTLSSGELDDARMAWIHLVQAEKFEAELRALQRNQALARSSTLTRFDPFLDSQGTLRVGGRLKHAVLSFDERHPVILPSHSHFTHLVVEACHRRALHGGVQLTLAQLRQRYWVPRGRALIKQLILRCVTCVRWRAASPQQLMSSLPKERVTAARPFLHTGVDYAGPIMLRTTKGRGHRSYKGFIAVFVCLATRAVHLEVVSDYSSDAFLAAFRRFTSRRGVCRSILSDCGTTFVGADAQLRRLFAASGPERRRFTDSLTKDGVEWRFNPPAAPHFGGIWEAAVKSVKHHLRRVIGETTLTFEELTTFLTQVEACLNSRPLQALSDDPDDLAALTPGHFLIGAPLTAIPEPSLLDQTPSRLDRWRLLQQMRDHFWDRWSREYLHSLVHRPKWFRRDTSLEVGRLCLLRNENSPPTRWPLARIIRLHRGEDDQVRVVTVRTAVSEFTRPVAKLVLLPDCRVSDVTEPRN